MELAIVDAASLGRPKQPRRRLEACEAAGKQATRLRVAEAMLWLSAALLIAVLQGIAGYEIQGRLNVVLGVVVLVYGVRVFLEHGGGQATVLGLFNLASSLFVGYAGAQQQLADPAASGNSYLAIAMTVCFSCQVLVTTWSWSAHRVRQPAFERSTARMSKTPFVVGATLFPVVAALRMFGESGLPGRHLEAVAFSSVVLLTVGAVAHPRPRVMVWRLGVATFALAIFASQLHGGGGRLRVVALAGAVVLLTTTKLPSRTAKWVAVACGPFVLWWLGQDRLNHIEAVSAGASEGRTGLESMVSPIRLCAQLIEAQVESGAHIRYGLSLLSVPLSLLPEGWVPWKPEAMGYELVALAHPSRVGSGYSVASTIYGEAIFNFTVFGAVLLVPALVWALRWLDGRWVRITSSLDNRSNVVPVAVLAVVAGSIADLVWNGTHLWLMRNLTRMPVLLLVWAYVQIRVRGMKPSEKRETRRAE